MVVGNLKSLAVQQGLQTLKGFRQEINGVSFDFYCSLLSLGELGAELVEGKCLQSPQ